MRTVLTSRRGGLWLAAGILAAGMVAAGFASATTVGGSEDVIQGCYKAATGQPRVIDPSSAYPRDRACTRDEVAISWNVQRDSADQP